MSRSRRDSATTGLGKRGYQSLGALLLVTIRDRPLPLGDELVEVVGLGRRQLAHVEFVEDEDVGAHEFADAFLPCAVRVAAGEVSEATAGLGEADVGALADGEVAEGLGDVGLADADGPKRMTDSPAWSQRRAPRSRIWARAVSRRR